MPDLVARPGDSHQADSAVEIRQVEVDLSNTIGSHPDDAGEQGHRFPVGRTAFHPHAGFRISAGAQPAALCAHAVDEPPIVVADLCTETALP